MASVASGFQGFSPELIDFLRDLGSNTTREWFQASGLFADFELPLPPQVFSAELTEVCFAHFQRLQPLQQWLVELLLD